MTLFVVMGLDIELTERRKIMNHSSFLRKIDLKHRTFARSFN